MSFQESAVETIQSSLTKPPNKAQFVFENPLKASLFVNSIQLSFDSYFSDKGVIMIKINGNFILPPKKAGTYQRLQNFSVPLKNEELFVQKKIEVFIWNGTDTNIVSVGLDILVSQDPNDRPTSDTPLSETLRNKSISEPTELFPSLIYFNQTETKLIDMKGYPKLILLMNSGSYVSPTVLLGGSGCVDGNLGTAGDRLSISSGTSPKDLATIDFGSIALRIPSARVFKFTNLDSTYTVTLEVSDDNVVYNIVDTQSMSFQVTNNFVGTEQSFRYLKVHLVYSSGSTATNQFDPMELFDGNVFGGTASLSFEILNENGDWIEYISASDLGSITAGNTISRTIGDVIANITSENFSKALPSTQTNFRSKLIVTGGGLNVSISIFKVG